MAGGNKRFVNPYNFIPLGEACDRKDITVYMGSPEERMTGYIDCSLELLTPLFIPNTSNPKALHRNGDAADGNSYEFFSYEDLSRGGHGVHAADRGVCVQPVIPGSELRGTVRSVFEAAFNGCMSSVQLDRTLHRRSQKPKKAGILNWEAANGGSWKLTPCNRYPVNTTQPGQINKYGSYVDPETYAGWVEGQEMYVRVRTRRNENKPSLITNYSTRKRDRSEGWERGYLHKGEYFPEKKCESIFIPKTKKTVQVDQGEIDRLNKLLERYRNPKLNRNMEEVEPGEIPHSGYQTYAEQWKGWEQGRTYCVYYTELRETGGGVHVGYLSPAMLSQEQFQTTPRDLLQQNGGYHSCDDRENVCSACALFGMVSGMPQASLGSRVRFEDAGLAGIVTEATMPHYFEKPVALPELGEPKPGTAEFYTFPPESLQRAGRGYPEWNYDYSWDKKTAAFLKPGELQIRGRKFYWHHQDSIRKYLFPESDEPVSRMRQRVRPLKKGNRFKFKIWYEQITRDELNRLLWSLDFADPCYAHKIGRAKPLGFGSIRIRVESIHKRIIHKVSGKWALEAVRREQWFPDENPAVRTLKIMLNWERKPYGVTYPPAPEPEQGSRKLKPNDTASHQWFTSNHKSSQFEEILKEPTDEIRSKGREGRRY